MHVFGPPRGPLQLEAVQEKPFDAARFVPFATPYTGRMKLIGGISTLVGVCMLMTLYVIDARLSLEQNLLYSAVMLAFFSFIGRLWMRPEMMGSTR
jgi:hypothetical protein